MLKFSTTTHTNDPTADQTDLNVTSADTADMKSRVQVRPRERKRQHSETPPCSWSKAL